MDSASWIILGTIFLYLAAMVLTGLYFNKKGGGRSSHEFFLGGRRLSGLVTAMSAEASDMSSYLLMGLPGLAYLCGVAEVGWTAIGLAVGTYLNFLFVARRLRRYSAQLQAITIPDFFSRRYHDNGYVLSCVAAVVILVFFIPYTASGFKAVGTLFHSLFGWDYHLAMLAGAVVIISYTVLGGFMAVSTTDLIQAIVMTIALAVAVFFGVHHAGGWQTVFNNAAALPGYLHLTQGYDAASRSASVFGLLSIMSTLAWGLGYFGMPHILLRFMAVRHENELPASRRIASSWVAVSMAVAILIGLIGYSVSLAGKIPQLSTASDSETVLIKLAWLMSQHGMLLTVTAGVVLSGILASTMSTADSQLLAAASSVSHDMLRNFLHINLKPRPAMLVARATVVAIALIALILAWDPNRSVFRVVAFAWAGFGAAFGPVMLFALFWKRSTRWGALSGMVAGGLMVFVWKYLVRPWGGVWDIYELLPAFLTASLVIVIVSLAGRAPAPEIQQEFENARRSEAAVFRS